VLLVQGAGIVGAGWRPQIEALRDHYTVYAFDNRGIGNSVLGKEGTISIDTMADDALAIMDAEKVDSFHVVGHSMGGLIAQAVALKARARIRSLSLLCSFVRGAEGARLTFATAMAAMRMRLGTRQMRRNAFLELILPENYLQGRDRRALAKQMAPLFGYDLAWQPLVTLRQVQAMARYDAGARWRELAAIPALVACASHDRIALPKYSRRLAVLLGAARYAEFPSAGHGVTIQCADGINDLLRKHFSGR
jgi:pimeloyl-ACP methyl ester carboxylesterase